MAMISCKSSQGTASDEANPFFAPYNTPFGVPPFGKILAKHYMPAFEKGMAEGRDDLRKILKQQGRS